MESSSTSPVRTALVTGASRGIGKEIAIALARTCARVHLLGRDQGCLEKVASTVESQGAESVIHRCDLALPTELKATIEKLEPIDVLIHNAGFGGPFHRIDEVSMEEWNLLLSTNLSSVHGLTAALLPDMKKKGYGRIIVISSIMGLFGGAGSSAYASTKHALLGYMRTLAVEWGPHGIRANAVLPGYTETEMLANYPDEKFKQQLRDRIPLRRFGRPQEIASLVSFLVSKEADFINGSAITIDGGMSASLT